MGAKCRPGLLCFSFSLIVVDRLYLLCSWRFLATIHFLVHGHMTSNNETVSRQMPRACKIANTMKSGNSSLLPAKCWPLTQVIRGGQNCQHFQIYDVVLRFWMEPVSSCGNPWKFCPSPWGKHLVLGLWVVDYIIRISHMLNPPM